MGACCENRPYGKPCGDCAFDDAPAVASVASGCPLCGGLPRTDPFSSALQWAVRMHALSSGPYVADAMVQCVATAPGVAAQGFRPTDVDVRLMLAIHTLSGMNVQLVKHGNRHAVEWDGAFPIKRGPHGVEQSSGGGFRLEILQQGGGKHAITTFHPDAFPDGVPQGAIGYEFSIRYCGLSKNSWMYQQVHTIEVGRMMVGDRELGGPTERTNVINEVFKVGSDGCTGSDDHATKTVIGRRKDGLCPLCYYDVYRIAEQWDDAKVEAKGGTARLDAGTPRPPEIPEDDPSEEMWGNEGFHVLRLRRFGTPCLYSEKRLDWINPDVKLVARGKKVGSWTMRFHWAVPCSPARREPGDPPPPRIPADPTPSPPEQPRPYTRTGRPTVVTGPGFKPDGKPLRPGSGGWRWWPGYEARPHAGADPVPLGEGSE